MDVIVKIRFRESGHFYSSHNNWTSVPKISSHCLIPEPSFHPILSPSPTPSMIVNNRHNLDNLIGRIHNGFPLPSRRWTPIRLISPLLLEPHILLVIWFHSRSRKGILWWEVKWGGGGGVESCWMGKWCQFKTGPQSAINTMFVSLAHIFSLQSSSILTEAYRWMDDRRLQ